MDNNVGHYKKCALNKFLTSNKNIKSKYVGEYCLNDDVNNIAEIDDNGRQKVREKSQVDPHEDQLVNESNGCILKIFMILVNELLLIQI